MYKLNKEDIENEKYIEKNIFFLHSLLPNQINIFSLKKIDDSVIDYVKENYKNMRYMIYPYYKYFFLKQKIYIENNVVFIDVENKESNYYNYKNIENELMTKIIKKKYVLTNKYVVFDEIDLFFTLEAFSMIFLKIIKKIDLNNIDYIFILGIVESCIKINIVSVPFEQKFNNKKFFDFQKINLKSLYISNQMKIFESWKNKKDVLLTGGTGIGKTSQIPKIYWWINYLFSGFKTDINFENFYFDLDNIGDIVKSKTVLCLPRKILIQENSLNVCKSLGFDKIENSFVNCNFKDVQLTTYHNKNIDRFDNSLLFCINRNVVLKNINTIIFDEIHEHDSFSDINISIIVKKKKELNIRNLVLITATILDDEKRLKEFIPDIEHIHIKGETLFSIKEHDYSDMCNRKNNYKNIEKIIDKFSFDSNKSTLIFLPTLSRINKFFLFLYKTLNKKKYELTILSRQSLKQNPDILNQITRKNDKHTIILSTPIAESSLTIKNLQIIIDTGLFFCKVFFGGKIFYITKSMKEQRKGRVGRLFEGTYIKLFKEEMLNNTYKKINYEFLFPYILYLKRYNLLFKKDLFILPDDLKRFDKTIVYFKNKKIDIMNNTYKIFNIFNKNDCSLFEYIYIYLYGTDNEKKVLKELENFKDEFFILNNKDILYNISKKLNIKIKNDKIVDFYEDFNQGLFVYIPYKKTNKYMITEKYVFY